MTMSHLIQASDIKVSFPKDGGGVHVVLDGVDLNITQGEFNCLVGPSGCGKTTLLNLILGSTSPTGGAVLVDGQLVSGVCRDRGVVYQKYSLFPHVKVWENVALGLVLEGTNLPQRILHLPAYFGVRRKAEELARKMILRVGLSEADGDKFPFELSGGMRQRVAIAQTLIMEPKVILMDEPFGALDPKTREEMQLLVLEQWRATGATFIFVTHDLEEALFLATRLTAVSQYWCKTSGERGCGARIVYDIAPPWSHDKQPDFRNSPEFNRIMAEVRSEAFDPERLQSESELVLTHPDAVQFEAKGGGG